MSTTPNSITRRQWAAMAVVVVLGLMAAGMVLAPGKRSAAADDAPRAAAASVSAASKGDTGVDHGAAPEPVRLTAEQRRAAGITTEPAGPKTMHSVTAFPGEIHMNEDRTAHVVPRYSGVVQSVPVGLGEQVRRGEVLAVIASTEIAEQRSELLTATRRRDLARSTHAREKRLWEERISAEQDYLQAQSALAEAEIAVTNAAQKLAAAGAVASSGGLNRFELRAPFDATVVEKHLALGEAVKEDASVFTLSDLGSVWVTFAVPPQQLAAVGDGAVVRVTSSAFETSATGTVSYVGALLGEQSRTATARVVLPNRDGRWRPGLFVTVSVLGASEPVKLAVNADAVHTVDNRPTVFVAVDAGFAARAVTVGRTDGKTTEILAGLKAGEQVAVANSFVLKAELGKDSAAEHGH